jgi:hypothetical protein|nr:MAG TPA: Protein of unknown function (DUF1043) [Caudoviricetes sp.]
MEIAYIALAVFAGAAIGFLTEALFAGRRNR